MTIFTTYNTEEVRNKLEEMGYKVSRSLVERDCLGILVSWNCAIGVLSKDYNNDIDEFLYKNKEVYYAPTVDKFFDILKNNKD